MQVIRDITTLSTPQVGDASQMYDWDTQYDESLGLPLQLRNQVSEPDTPSIHDSPRMSNQTATTRARQSHMGEATAMHPRQAQGENTLQDSSRGTHGYNCGKLPVPMPR